jgi:hypothetical protein
MASNDIESINRTVNDYFKGLKIRNLELLVQSWHPEARICYVSKGAMSSSSFSLLESLCQQQDELGTITDCRLVLLDCTGSVAVAKVELILENSQSTTNYTDYLTMMKFSCEKWLIVNKSFHAERIPKKS